MPKHLVAACFLLYSEASEWIYFCWEVGYLIKAALVSDRNPVWGTYAANLLQLHLELHFYSVI